ncbi:MAG: phosphonate ABC transporter ATP-binding protein [Gemmatimonas sp. SG8_17]|nr:MAG: phosphonate ABC transporter ATP-binding protein [Gemmatimonas sp. SG8_17]
MISLRNVEKFFLLGNAKQYVLRQITVDIEEGEFVTVMGPSGAGKSTLLGIVGMLIVPWREHDPFAQRLGYTIGFVFQQYHLLDDLTVYENLDIPLSYRNVPRGERQGIVADTLDKFQIVAKKDLYPRQLSGGQQQLVAVARAMVASPRLILADEPTGSLHSSQGRMIMDLLKKLNDGGTTIIQVTHNEEYSKYGNRIINLHDGWLVD